MNIQKLYETFRLWTVSEQQDGSEKELFRGTKTACEKYMRENNLYRAWKKGASNISLANLIWDKDLEPQTA